MNKIFVISGPSGVGKGTIEEGMLKNPDLNLYWAKSYTTRAKRESDKNENHYLFVSKEKFLELEKQGEVTESNNYNGDLYGSSKSEIENALSSGKNVLKDIDVNGGVNYKKLYPQAILIFIKADLNDIKNRLISRGQNTEEEIEKRLEIAKNELSYQDKYDYCVTNLEGYPEKAIEEVREIVRKELKNG